MNRDFLQRLKERIARWCYRLLLTLGTITALAVLLTFTDLPYHAYHKLGSSDIELTKKPDIIVMLGGSGMPSPDGLIRTFYTAEAAEKYPDTRIIIASPFNKARDSIFQLRLMKRELVVKGIDSTRISYEPYGFSTRSQALNVLSMFQSSSDTIGILLITSPEHVYRSVQTFRKAGFAYVGGVPADEKPLDADKVKDKDQSGDMRVKSLAFRYNIWSYLHYELYVVKEYCAIAYYWLKGWI